MRGCVVCGLFAVRAVVSAEQRSVLSVSTASVLRCHKRSGRKRAAVSRGFANVTSEVRCSKQAVRAGQAVSGVKRVWEPSTRPSGLCSGLVTWGSVNQRERRCIDTEVNQFLRCVPEHSSTASGVHLTDQVNVLPVEVTELRRVVAVQGTCTAAGLSPTDKVSRACCRC